MRVESEPDEALVKNYLDNVDKHFAAYVTILSKRKYLAGGEISLAGLYYLLHSAVGLVVGFKEVMDKYPHVVK
jgi:glutathione S-transferase